jgi:hypothetical protein
MEKPRHRETSIIVRALDTDCWDEIPLGSIQSVTLPDDEGSIEVVYSVKTMYADGRVIGELRTGESTIDRLFIALGWHSDHDPGASYTAPLHH